MSCVRAAPTAAPAMRLVTRSTVMAVGNTLVGERGTGQRMDSWATAHPWIPPVLQAPSMVVPHTFGLAPAS